MKSVERSGRNGDEISRAGKQRRVGGAVPGFERPFKHVDLETGFVPVHVLQVARGHRAVPGDKTLFADGLQGLLLSREAVFADRHAHGGSPAELVPGEGIEPSLCYQNQILSLARLPISPPRQGAKMLPLGQPRIQLARTSGEPRANLGRSLRLIAGCSRARGPSRMRAPSELVGKTNASSRLRL